MKIVPERTKEVVYVQLRHAVRQAGNKNKSGRLVIKGTATVTIHDANIDQVKAALAKGVKGDRQ
jgi:hypothetical protein